MEEQICGVEIGKIKKAFFEGKLSQLISSMQAAGQLNNVVEAKALKVYLGTLKTQHEAIVEEMKDGFAADLGEDEIKPPSVEELSKNDVDIEKWTKDKEAALSLVRAKMKVMRDKLGSSSKFEIKELQDLAFELTFWTMWLSQDVIYKRQLWKRRLTQLIDDYAISRREAEDYSELTKEYRDYKLSEEFKKTVDNLIISARRGYTE